MGAMAMLCSDRGVCALLGFPVNAVTLGKALLAGALLLLGLLLLCSSGTNRRPATMMALASCLGGWALWPRGPPRGHLESSGFADDDEAYENRKLRAQVVVLREDLTAKDNLGGKDYLTGYYELKAPSVLDGEWALVSRVPSLCRDRNSSTVFHVSIGYRSGTPLASFLQTACPGFDEAVPLAIDRAVARAAALHVPSWDALCVTVRVETFNVPLDDVLRTEPTGATWRASNATMRRLATIGCRKLSLPSRLEQPPLTPSCINLTRPDHASLSRRLMKACKLPHDADALRSTYPSTVAEALSRPVCQQLHPRNATVGRGLWPTQAKAPLRPRWLRVLGDSVAYSMVGVLARAFFTGSVGGSVELARGKSGKGPPSWMIMRSKDTRLWMSFESGFDSGGSSVAGIRLNALTHSTTGAPAELITALGKAGPTLIYVSFGSHANNVGGDSFAELRYRAALAGLWAAQPAGSQLVVATESARGKGVPSRFEGSPCQSSNLRVEARGLAAIRALRSVCPDTKQCRVLDLFGATLPHIFDAKVYKLGDPVHFHVHGRLAVPISDHVCEAFHTCN